MPESDAKADLHRGLRAGREVLLWKLEGLSDYDMRRPLVRTATNLLGLVRHVASIETGYFGLVFGRPFPEALPWMDDGEPNGDMWVRASENSTDVIDFFRRAATHSDATIDTLPLDTIGQVPWWPEGGQDLTLQQALIHVIIDTQRHAGQADVVREMIDGTVGAQRFGSNLPPGDDAWWNSYRQKVDEAAHDGTKAH
jgi:uncharacterized damage-inducible protein DinB